tara:strand:- start:1320 stop:1574 length:255 start_codon:yes stop_codon:yes gene_type:complete
VPGISGSFKYGSVVPPTEGFTGGVGGTYILFVGGGVYGCIVGVGVVLGVVVDGGEYTLDGVGLGVGVTVVFIKFVPGEYKLLII